MKIGLWVPNWKPRGFGPQTAQVRYRLSNRNSAEVNVAIAATHTLEFSKAFGKELIAAELALPQGLRISRFRVVRTELKQGSIGPRHMQHSQRAYFPYSYREFISNYSPQKVLIGMFR